MLEEQDIPALERIVLLRDDDEGTFSEPTRTDEVPIFGWREFLAGAEGVVEGDGPLVGVATDERAVMAAWRAVKPEDLSDLIFTSGTTGRPKGAMTSHGQTLRTFGTWASIVGLSEGDRYLIVNPFFHTFGYKAGIIACLVAEGVEEGIDDQVAVALGETDDRGPGAEGPQCLAVGGHGPLGPAGGARGEDQVREILRLDRPPGCHHRPLLGGDP